MLADFPTLGAIMTPYIEVVAPRMQVLDDQQGFRHYFCPRLEERQQRRYGSYPSSSSVQDVTLLLSGRVLHQPREVMYVGGAESMCDDIIQFDEMLKNCRWEGAGGKNGESSSRVNVLHKYQVFPAFANNYFNHNFMTLQTHEF